MHLLRVISVFAGRSFGIIVKIINMEIELKILFELFKIDKVFFKLVV